MTEPKKRAPKLRFKGFTDDWEQRKLGELIENQTILLQSDGNHGELYPKSNEFSETGIPYLSASNIDLNTSTIDFSTSKYLPINKAEKFRKGIAKDGDILLAHNATVGPTVILSTNYPFVILSTTLTLFRINQSKMNPNFFLYTVRSMQFQNALKKMMKQTTRNQVPILTQRNIDVSYPNNIDEQTKLGIFFKQLDDTIALHQQKLTLLKRLKQTYLYVMFPQNNENSPTFRFRSFANPWEERKFKDFVSKSGKKNTEVHDFPAYSVSNKLGLVKQSDQFDGSRLDDLDKSDYKMVHPEEFAYNPARINIGSLAFNNLEETVLVSSLYVVIKMSKKLDNEYVLQFLKSNRFIKEVKKNTEGSVREYLFFENFKNIKFPYTSNLEEQVTLSSFLKKLDCTIDLHQCKLEKLLGLKQILLSKMLL